jgi:hypothetical protein
VSIAGNPVARIPVLLLTSSYNPPKARTITDAAGRFRFEGVAAGRYVVGVIAPVFVVDGQTDDGSPGRSVSVRDGEQVDGVNLALAPGGVITGRVTDADGAPVSAEAIKLERLGDDGSAVAVFRHFADVFQTDDRGVYRAYGLAPGRYRVSVGVDPGRRAVGSRTFYARRFYPSTPDPAKAVPVEVSSSVEATAIDIPLGKPSSAYSVTGRIVDADTGKVYPRTSFGWGYSDVRTTDGGGTSRSGSWSSGGQSDDRGAVQIDGLSPGKYSASALVQDADAGRYGETATFEVIDHDLTDVELKIRRGLSVGGTVIIEGEAAAEASTAFQELDLYARYSDRLNDLASAYSGRHAAIAPDGSFTISGLRPGKIGIGLQIHYVPGPSGPSRSTPRFWIIRIEGPGSIDNSTQPVSSRLQYYDNAIEIPEGPSLSGLRVILERASARVRGSVIVKGGDLPPGRRIMVFWRTLGRSGSVLYGPDVDVDANGRFLLESLAAGQYEITAHAVPTRYPIRLPDLISDTQTVTLADGQTSEVTLVIDVAGKDKSKDR